MVGEQGGEEDMQFLGSAADSSNSLAAVITHFIYASQRNHERRESSGYYRSSNSRKFWMLNCVVLLLTLKIDSNKTIEAKEKYLKEWQQRSLSVVFTMLDQNGTHFRTWQC